MKNPCDRLHSILTATTILFFGAFIGAVVFDFKKVSGSIDTPSSVVRMNDQTYVAVRNLTDEFKVELEKDSEFAVYNGQTWIPVPGNPVELVVLNDSECGQKCDTTQAIGTLRQVITPALLVRNVEVDSDEGNSLISDFDIVSVPQYILGDGIEGQKSSNGTSFLEESQDLVIENDGLYLIDGAKVGFRVGKFLKAPIFADIDTEPSQGTGKLKVVEFTDYQCPYCKRLHDNNKSLIKKLIQEDKIEYIMKDFPLGFHREAMAAHVAANCAQQVGDNETYWDMHDRIFDTQSEWSGKGEGNAKLHFKTLAMELILDEDVFETCQNDKSMQEEVLADQAEGSKYGVTGTPALFIGKQIMPGAIGAAAFEKAVEEELK